MTAHPSHAMVDQHIADLRHLSGPPARRGRVRPRATHAVRRRLGWGLVDLGLRLLAPLQATDRVGRRAGPLARAR
jgi:hypothetical protein